MTGPVAERERTRGWLATLGVIAFGVQSLLGPVVTLCVDADGRAHIEFAASGCCEAGPRGDAEGTSRESHGHQSRSGCGSACTAGDVLDEAPAATVIPWDAAPAGPHCESCNDIGLADVLRGVVIPSLRTTIATTLAPSELPSSCASELAAVIGRHRRPPDAEPGGSGWPAGFTIPMTS